MTAVAIGPVRPLCRCGAAFREHSRNAHGICEHCTSCDAYNPLPEIRPRPTVARLLADVAAGIRVLRTYGVDITDEQINERTNNIVMGLLGNYQITGMGDLT